MWGEPMLPQTKVLSLVDLFIHHGGQSSTVEGFYYGKPMIVMPFTHDQFDNAQRIEEKGFGIQINSNKWLEKELIDAIDCLLNDEELKKRMRDASLRIQNEMKGNKLINLIESLVN